MNLTSHEAKTLVETYVHQQVTQIEGYVRRNYGIKNFKVDVTVNYSARSSWGGTKQRVPFIDLALQKYIPTVQANGNCSFIEYPSFAFNKEIGSVIDVHWKKAIMALITHEVAHAIQFYDPMQVVNTLFANHSEVTVKEFRGHKKLWKNIYKDLRIQFVNSNSSFDTLETKQVVTPKEQQVVKETVKPASQTVTKPVGKKTWTVVKTKKANGLQVEYIEQSTGKVLLTLLDRLVKSILVWDANTKQWIDTQSLDRVAVRKQYLNGK